jgi:integrase
MPRVFRQQYTRPIPEGAQRVTLKGKNGKPDRPAVRFKGPGGKAVIAPLTKGGDRCRVASPTWYGWVGGKAVPLCPNKAAAEVMLADKVREAARAGAGMADPHAEHRGRPLSEHLADWEAELRTRPVGKRRRPPTAKQVALKVGRARRLLEGCGFRLAGDITLAKVQEYLDGLTAERAAPPLAPDKAEFTKAEAAQALGVSPSAVPPLVRRWGLPAAGKGKARRFPRATVEALLDRRVQGLGRGTAGYYAREAKAFTRWLDRRRRLPEDPLADLPGASPNESDHRHDRRTPTDAELRGLIAAAAASGRPFRSLPGPDRALLYATAAASGFRVEELASLTPESFDLAGEVSAVTLAGDVAKNGRTAVQPLPPDVTEALRGWLARRPAGRPVWPGNWFRRAAEMLRADLAAAGIPYAVEGPDGPLFLDFHALRHGYVALLDKAGATLKEAMHLARHSDPKLTMARYGRAHLHDLAAAVERLPRLLPEAPQALRATGTDGGAYRALTGAADRGGGRLSAAEGEGPKVTPPSARPNPLSTEAVEDSGGRSSGAERSSGGWDRTSDTRLMKPLL